MYVHRRRTRIEIWTPAKLNLYLEVLGRRSDGYHEIETLMVPVNLYDTLRLAPREDGQLHLSARWDLGCYHASSEDPTVNSWGDLPTGADNLVLKALVLLRQRAEEAGEARGGMVWGADVELVKRIPSAAGLGGGSSDAAAAMRAANELWQLNWSSERLATVAAELGSDIPFFFRREAAFCTGRGERVQTWPWPGPMHVVIVRPPTGLATGPVYRETRIASSPRDGGALKEAWASRRIEAIAKNLFNRLQEAGVRLSADVERVQREFAKLDLLGHQMSGSGSCYFGVCRNARHARRVAGMLRARRVGHVFCAASLGPGCLAG